MAYQSKTYSLSDEVVAAIDEARGKGESPNRFLRRMMGVDEVKVGRLSLDDDVWEAVKALPCSLNQYLRASLIDPPPATSGRTMNATIADHDPDKELTYEREE